MQTTYKVVKTEQDLSFQGLTHEVQKDLGVNGTESVAVFYDKETADKVGNLLAALSIKRRLV